MAVSPNAAFWLGLDRLFNEPNDGSDVEQRLGHERRGQHVLLVFAAVVAERVEDQHPVGPAQAGDAFGHVAGFVFSQDDGG